MDIVDVDEALKDDSFIFLEDKTHDDISNILQQWKSNNSIPPSDCNFHQPHQQQHPQEQAYKYDSRTFTRPKRKSAQNLEMQFTNSLNTSQLDNPLLNVEIGGLVTNMQKSLLQDTSPPAFSSVDTSMDRMNNSLITSADFSNIHFLQSTSSLDFCGSDTVGYSHFNFAGKITNDGYTLNDMIRDRKALESLTMSSDGTLIKDSHIGQIDDISLTLSKTASGCSTMDNSTESVEVNNRTVEMVTNNLHRTFNNGVQLELAESYALKTSECSNSGKRIPSELQRTMILSDEMIGDITYNLIENSMHSSLQSDQALSAAPNMLEKQFSAKEHLSKPASTLYKTICLSNEGAGHSEIVNTKVSNSTFDCQNVTPGTRCETPERIEKNTETIKFYESTPQTKSVRYNKQHYTPTLKMVDDVNISPIVASSANTPHKASQILKDTFESENNQLIMNETNNIINTKTFSGKLPLMNNDEMIDNMENPTFYKNSNRLEELHSPASLEMKNVMELAQAEANLLASNNNEEEFDHMLDEFSKVELNAEQIKMKKSLDSIKKRFNYGSNRNKTQQREISREAKDMRDMIRVSTDLLGEDNHCTKDYLNMTMDIITKDRENTKKSNELLIESPNEASGKASDAVKTPLKDSCTTSSITDSKTSNGLSSCSVSSVSNGGERLLSRRSRLYDDFSISTASANSTHSNKISLGSSFTIHKDDDNISDIRPNVTNETENLISQDCLEMVQERPDSTAEEQLCSQNKNNTNTTPLCGQYRLAEKRERDRDRFKTIKINKTRNCDDGNVDSVPCPELNVPCIDDYPIEVNTENLEDSENTNQRYSRRDKSVSPVFNNNKSETKIETVNKTASKINQNFLTYKKPKEKQQLRNLPETASGTTNAIAIPDIASLKPRSLSRPRYLSGLTKFSAVSKALSADELEKTISRQTNSNAMTSASNISFSKGSNAANLSLIQKQTSKTHNKKSDEPKSPMGIKSKSFHNLSNHHTYASSSAAGGVGGLLAPKTFGLRKPSATVISTEKLVKANRNLALSNPGNVQNPSTQQKSDESVFKVPKLVSSIRAPGSTSSGTTTKRAGLVRPSSGYYSLTVTAKGVQQPSSETDCDAGRHSPTDSMSSASSKGSAHSLNKAVAVKIPNASSGAATAVLTKITIGSTGIPKPSGLRPPSSVKRSGLPRPSSFIKTDK